MYVTAFPTLCAHVHGIYACICSLQDKLTKVSFFYRKPYLLVAAGLSILRSVDMNGSEWETLVKDIDEGITSLDYHYEYVYTYWLLLPTYTCANYKNCIEKKVHKSCKGIAIVH